MFAEQMASAINDARTLTRLDDLSRAIWQGWGVNAVTDDQAQDLARIPMRVERTPSPVEQFTIALEPGGGAVTNLVMTWENTRASVPIEAATGGR